MGQRALGPLTSAPVRRDNGTMSSYLWPNDEGWPYPDADADADAVDLDATADDDVLSLRAAPNQLFDLLEPLERKVIMAHYGLEGQAPRSMKELHTEMGLPRAELRDVLGTGLTKLRTGLA
jgi:DNA-directed RNA polymerase sigma subunit (sigma70/sigma32)